MQERIFKDGVLIETKELPDDPVTVRAIAQATGADNRRALVRARAAALRKAGKHVEARSLLSTIGE